VASRPRPKSPVAFESAEPAEAPRSRHVVDRGLEYRVLQRQGMTPQAIQRRKRKSKAYVSIVLRFGRLLEKLDPIEVAVLRHPRTTYKLLQRVVSADADDRRVVQELRTAITLPKPDGRRRRRLKLKPAPPPSDPDAFTFRWDASSADRDPLGYLEALEAYLRRVQRGVDHRMKELLARAAPNSGSVGAMAASVVARGGGPCAPSTRLSAAAHLQLVPTGRQGRDWTA
jgi:hypothetical protein